MGGSTGRARIALTAALALLWGLGIGRVEANNATYNPADKSLGEISRPSSGTATGSYTLAIISPSQLGGPNGGAFPAGGVVVNAKLTSTSRPDGVSVADALGLVSIVPAGQQYTALSQSKDFVVTVTVSPTTFVGDYTYVIQGDPTIHVTGWGLGSASFSFSVVEPSPSDVTPPTIVLSVPTPVTFCLGGTPVVFSFTASDADSPISSVVAKVNGEPVPVTTTGLGTGDVTGEGVFTAAAIGAYAVTIEATSDGGTGSDTEEARVRYQLTWLPPLSLGKTAKGGSTVPIKFTVRDCHGDFVYDDSVRVAVYELTTGGAVEQLSGVYGTGASSVRIDTTSEQYIVNFQTEPGVRNYAADVWFGDTDEPQGSKTFSVR
jgi:hypothetical protein